VTKVWDCFIGAGLLLIAVATVVLRRGATTTSVATQLILFIVIGSILLVLGLIMRYIQRDETDAPDIDVPPYGIGILGVAACLAGLYWSTAGIEEWSPYAKLPVIALADVEKQPVGTTVRLEGVAEAKPPLRAADGSELALQRVEFSHQEKGWSSRSRTDVSDYEGVLPELILLRDEVAHTTAGIRTTEIDPQYCVLPRSYTRLNGDKEEVAKRAANAISPAFTDYHYTRSGTSGVSVLSLPQKTAVTVCGVVDAPLKMGLHPVRAVSISTLIGDQFNLRSANVSVATRVVATLWWFIGIAILVATALAIRIYRRTK
jgi:hypothetical protein